MVAALRSSTPEVQTAYDEQTAVLRPAFGTLESWLQ